MARRNWKPRWKELVSYSLLISVRMIWLFATERRQSQSFWARRPRKKPQKAVEKLRKVISEVRLPGKDGGTALAVQFSAGLAEAVIRPEYDVVDIVTEVINRAEQALALSQAQGAGKAVVLGPARCGAGRTVSVEISAFSSGFLDFPSAAALPSFGPQGPRRIKPLLFWGSSTDGTSRVRLELVPNVKRCAYPSYTFP